MERHHIMPFGAQIADNGAVCFRLWAPSVGHVHLCLDDHAPVLMERRADGWHEWTEARARAGSRYLFQIDEGRCVPDPASRYNPDDVHGSSQVVDPAAFEWHDAAWRGRPWEEMIIYEVHVGTFTEEGTFCGLEKKLDHLVDLGVTAVELMPVADFPGRRDWGYDGVLLFAPDSRYGMPGDLKRLVQEAHRRNLMVLLDVVYNHFGPEGNYLHVYVPEFFSRRHHTPWGAAINFDEAGNRTVRDFYIHNALYWLEEYHFDGLRLDAAHAILDDSKPDILEELAGKVRAVLGDSRHIHLILENDDNAVHYLKRGANARVLEYDAQWNDDMHHALHVLLTRERDGYYEDYADNPIEHLGRCLSEGFSYQGQRSGFRHGAQRGESSKGLSPTSFVSFLQNHDQVGNRAFGERLTSLAVPDALCAAAALLLLAPSPPLLFMGEEWGAREPFLFFCDFADELGSKITAGRRREFSDFTYFDEKRGSRSIPDPGDPHTFELARLDWRLAEHPHHRARLALYKRLLSLRRDVIVPFLRGSQSEGYSVFSPEALSAAWRLGDGARLSVFANLAERSVCLSRTPIGTTVFCSSFDAERQLRSGTLIGHTVAWYMERNDGRT